MDFYGWRPYVPVAKRRQKAAKEMAKLKKKGHPVSPVVVEGRTIVKTFWGKAWCENLEQYSDFANRLPRGRTYVRNGSVIDLQIAPGEITALVSGSSIYKVAVKVAPVEKARWQSICKDCAGAIDSLIELLQGRFSKGVMERVCRQKTGLFPSPHEITLSCSCPDWAGMCKHVAAVLYGIGARLDHQPELLFRLHSVAPRSWVAKTSRLSLDWRWRKTLAPQPQSRSVRKHGPARRSRQWWGERARFAQRAVGADAGNSRIDLRLKIAFSAPYPKNAVQTVAPFRDWLLRRSMAQSTGRARRCKRHPLR
jgi:uncharacterized Zn finger protein